VLADARLAARGAPSAVYEFEGANSPGRGEPPGLASARTPRIHRNPVVLAQEWQEMLASEACTTRAALARRLDVTRARVTQVLGVLQLDPRAVVWVASLGDPLTKPIVTERGLRALARLPGPRQLDALRRMLDKAALF
jgi:hypothetical protein